MTPDDQPDGVALPKAAEAAAPAAETSPSELSTQGLPGTGSGALRVRCPQCHNPVEIGDDEPLSEIRCRTCDSSFSLLQDTYATPTVMNIGHFELIERLGTGGFGTVWKARDTQLDRTVAIKIPRQGRLASAELEQLFFREARAAAQLKHPGIVSVHEVGRDEDTIYIVSDLVRGASLSEWLSAAKPTVRTSAELCAKLADALHHAHEAGVVHRDIKPSNIMIDLDGEPHIMDFGMARRDAGEVTVTVEGQMIGTPAFMSPEQARGEAHHADRRSDVYSLGVILYQLLTGELPFRGQTRMLVLQILRDEPPKPRTLNSRIPRDLQTIALKCLEKEPARRYATAADLADDLRRFLRGEPIRARPLGAPARTWRWCKRNPAKAALVAMLLLAAVGASLVAVREAQRRQESEAAEKQTRRRLYMSDMNVALHSWETGNLARVLDLLARHRPASGQEDLRRFEWYYLWGLCQVGLCAPRLENVTRADSVNDLAYSSDGTLLVTAGGDKVVKVWERTSADGTKWKPKFTLTGHVNRITAVALSRDGKTLASASEDATVRLWSMATGRQQGSLLEQAYNALCVAFSPDGKTLVVGGGDPLKQWDVTTGKELHSLEPPTSGWFCSSVAFSPDGTRLAAGFLDGRVGLWDAASGKRLRELKAHPSVVRRVIFSPDGNTLASGSDDQSVKLWDTATFALRRTLSGHKKEVTGLAFSPDGDMLASGGLDSSVKFWDAASGMELGTIQGHLAGVNAVAFSPDGQTLASASSDNTVKFWDVDAKLSAPMRHSASSEFSVVYDLAFSPDGTTLASVGDGTELRLWDASTGASRPTSGQFSEALYGLAVSPDGRTLATAGLLPDFTVKLMDMATGRNVRTFSGHTGVAWKVTFSPDGKLLASTGGDNTIRVWDVATGKNLHTWEGNDARVGFSPDGVSLAGGVNELVALWDVRIGALQRTFTGHGSSVECVVFSPDGATLASGSGDQTVRFWDAATGENRHTLVGHSGVIESVAFSPDGATLASASSDWTVKLWDVTSGEERGSLVGHTAAVHSVAFSQDGNTLASCSEDGTVRLWHGTGNMPADESPYDRWTRKAHVFAHVNNWRKAAESFSRAIELDPNHPELFIGSAQAYVNLGRWKEAADAYARAIDLDPTDQGSWFASSALRYEVGGLDDYRRHCRELLARFGETDDPAIAQRMARRCLVIPGAVDDLSVPVRLAELAITRDADNPWTQLPKGMAEYRTGRFESAVAWLEKSSEGHSEPYGAALSQLFLAMAQYQLGQVDEARESLNEAIAIVERQQPLEGGPYYSSPTYALFAQFARREAEKLLATPPPPR